VVAAVVAEEAVRQQPLHLQAVLLPAALRHPVAAVVVEAADNSSSKKTRAETHVSALILLSAFQRFSSRPLDQPA